MGCLLSRAAHRNWKEPNPEALHVLQDSVFAVCLNQCSIAVNRYHNLRKKAFNGWIAYSFRGLIHFIPGGKLGGKGRHGAGEAAKTIS